MFFYVYVIIAGVDSNTASRCTEDILCQVLMPSFHSNFRYGLFTTIVIQLDAAATIFSLLVIVRLLFEGRVNFFGGLQTLTMAG